MSFELKTTDDGERVEESITTEHTTVKIWTKEQITKEVAKLQAEIQEKQDRIIVLLAQNDKFTVEAEAIK